MDESIDPHPRVVELQERVAFLERDVETLDGVVRELAGRLEATARELARLREDTAGRLDEVVRSVGEAADGAAGGGAGPDGRPSGPGGAGGIGPDLGRRPDDPFVRDLPPHWGRAPGRSGD